jgi:hypothetical protein
LTETDKQRRKRNSWKDKRNEEENKRAWYLQQKHSEKLEIMDHVKIEKDVFCNNIESLIIVHFSHMPAIGQQQIKKKH